MTTLLDSYRAATVSKSVGNRSLATGRKILGRGLSLAGGLIRTVGGLLFRLVGGLSGLWGIIVNSAFAISNFNWTATDEQLDQQIEGLKLGLASLLGATLGNAAGWLACGIVPGALIYSFNIPLGLFVLKNVGEEALEELIGNASAIARYTSLALLRGFIYNTYKGIRKLFFVDSPLTRGLASALGINYDEAKSNYLSRKSRHWSFASAWEEKLDSIDNQFLRNFLEEFSEEFVEGCIEAGFVVTYSVESWLSLQKQSTQSALGPERVVEIQPDRSTAEKIIVAGPETLVKQQVIQVVTDHQMLDKRDVGTIVAAPVEEYLRAKPRSLSLEITMATVQSPPFGAAKLVTITVPDLKRSAIDWEQIKLAVGGSNGYMWGRFYARAFLDTGRQLTVFAATEDEAKDRVKALLLLSDATMRTMTIGEEAREGERQIHPELQKDPTRVFPAYMTLFNRAELLNTTPDRGYRSIRESKKYEMKSGRINLWVPTKPSDWDEAISGLLTVGY